MLAKVLIAAGGTGGHIFPAVSLAQALKSRSPQTNIIFAGAFAPAMLDRLKNTYGFNAERIKAAKMPYGLGPGAFLFCVQFLLSLIASIAIINRHKPSVIVSMGSFSGGPFVIAGRLFNKPVLIHEQNYTLGRGNWLSAYLAQKIAVSFPATLDKLDGALKKKAVYTGNPVRRQFFGANTAGALDFFDLKPDKFTILIMGGSQGARRINEVFIETARGLDKARFQVLHLAGEEDFEFVSRAYERLGFEARVFKFLDSIENAYAASSLVISRSGAATVAEIAASSRASILIPYPYSGAHQAENARALEAEGAAKLLRQEDLTAGGLLKIINSLAADKALLEQMRDSSKKLAKPDAAQCLAAEVMSLSSWGNTRVSP